MTTAPADPIDAARAEWAHIHPDLDSAPMAVAGRLRLVAAALARATDPVVKAEGLTRPEFDVLSAVRRSGTPLTPTGIAAATLASGAATTKRLDHLTAVGHLERTPDERDGRVTRLSLTATGTELVDRLLPRILEAEGAFAAALGPHQQQQLAQSLRVLLQHAPA
ncbi:MarR family winged helix-turn-helix transcriptional regulator [Kineococcus rhizosphaerae]|uniref:DNA-binding MarR family transcriptional regulator n=1 Tax=Kineococcus rhizosphaerae TaxID=559628 RepID=A0A2T0QY41_9ACTN|nr:MarR family transcriptional regulator [Kineococcus rhizosphaerae]PRY11125.1 DNA-binding MarR family transcriptional regulator [Kineococcus rhizosphaerae]